MKRKQIYWLIVFLIVIQGKSFSQVVEQKSIRNLIYLEAFGAGGYGSLNYERIIFQTRNKLPPNLKIGVRLGISTFHLKDFNNKFNPDVIIPVAINAIYGRLLKTPDGHVVTMAYWQQKENVSHDEVPYYEKKR